MFKYLPEAIITMVFSHAIYQAAFGNPGELIYNILFAGFIYFLRKNKNPC
jgi:hypothetical protein